MAARLLEHRYRSGHHRGSRRRPDADEVLTLEGPVERFDGKLALVIPLDEGGDKFLECCCRISEAQGIASRSRSPNG
jgi:hypothetical protein